MWKVYIKMERPPEKAERVSSASGRPSPPDIACYYLCELSQGITLSAPQFAMFLDQPKHICPFI